MPQITLVLDSEDVNTIQLGLKDWAAQLMRDSVEYNEEIAADMQAISVRNRQLAAEIERQMLEQLP